MFSVKSRITVVMINVTTSGEYHYDETLMKHGRARLWRVRLIPEAREKGRS